MWWFFKHKSSQLEEFAFRSSQSWDEDNNRDNTLTTQQQQQQQQYKFQEGAKQLRLVPVNQSIYEPHPNDNTRKLKQRQPRKRLVSSLILSSAPFDCSGKLFTVVARSVSSLGCNIQGPTTCFTPSKPSRVASDKNVHLERCQSFRKSVKENPHIPRKESSPALSPWFSETLLNFSPLWFHKQLWSLTDLCLISRRLQRKDKIWGF